MIRLRTSLPLLLLLGACTPAPSSNTASKPAAVAAGGSAVPDAIPAMSGVAATVGGAPITYEELDKEAAAQLIRLRSQAYDVRKQTLDTLVNDRIIEAAAKAKGQSKDDFLKVEVTDKVGTVTEAEAKEYFDKNPPRGGNVDFERLKPRVIQYLQRQREDETRNALITRLRADAEVRVMLEPLRFNVTFDDKDPRSGSPDAPITIVEFSDFQCPYCSRVLDTMKQVKDTYGDKVSVVFQNTPLPMHKDAPKAAEAGQCAHDAGKFWELHDLMFTNQQALSVDDLKKYARQIGIDGDAFDTCLDSGKYADDVAADMAEGAAVGVTGTPAFFINGQFLNGAQPFEKFKEAIDSELASKGLR